tara:strand:+ start:3576 stop:4781 length:1206 start_codon:yes stop_codon:yes gene_type:complete
MINLEIPKHLKGVASMAHDIAQGMFRPISRKYDKAEHTYPSELDTLGAILQGLDEGGSQLGADGLSRKDKKKDNKNRNGRNMGTVLNVAELCWGDLGLMLTIPGQGLGNAAIAAVATPEQKERFQGKWASMAITEPGAGSDSANIQTTARLDGEEWVLNGEKIYVTCGERSDLVVVWATLDKAQGRAAIKSFVVEKGTPGLEVARLDKKLGIRASDTATILLNDCRIPRNNLLGSEEIDVKKSFAGAMKTFDNTRPAVAAMALGVAKAALDLTRELLRKEGIKAEYQESLYESHTIEAEIYRMEAEWEAARLLTLKAAWMADNNIPNSMHASMCKAKAGKSANDITLKCVELCGGLGYSEELMLEKWARDSKITDIFEGTQQIQRLIIARQLLGKSSKELR